jgi:DNA segregation ATPase FtsK/SpoIIIE-like protein
LTEPAAEGGAGVEPQESSGLSNDDEPPDEEGPFEPPGDEKPPAPPGPKAPASPARTARGVFDLPHEQLRELSGRLDDVLTSYGLPLQPVEASEAVCGPNTVRFRLRMARGGTIAQVEARERDIMRELGLAKPLMVGQDAGFVTLDVPRDDPVTLRFEDIAPSLEATDRARGELPVLFGVDIAGRPRIEDLAQLPHLLVAGTTGSGKSVFLSSILGSLVRLPREALEIVLVDVKGLDFAPFVTLPHLRQPPITDAEEALEVLDDLYATERSRRRKVLSAAGAQSILDYFGRLGGTDLKQVVIVIDEYSNLLAGDKATGSRLEDTIQQYAEIMRSFGIYLVIATQRPSADIVTGRIKSNLPARCAFRLPTHSDSVTILGRKGAEALLGKGDMLFYRDGVIERLQAPLVSAQDVLAAAQ